MIFVRLLCGWRVPRRRGGRKGRGTALGWKLHSGLGSAGASPGLITGVGTLGYESPYEVVHTLKQEGWSSASESVPGWGWG